MNKLLSITAGLGFAAFAMIATPSFAGDVHSQNSMSVQYGDLDTSTKAGAKALIGRIKSAAKTVCGTKPDIRDIVSMRDYSVCVDGAIEAAVDDLGDANVFALYHGKPRVLAQN